MNGGIEVFPDESVMLDISENTMGKDENIFTGHSTLLDEVLLGHIPGGKVTDTIYRHYAYVFNSTQKILD